MKKIHLDWIEGKDNKALYKKNRYHCIHMGNGITVRFGDKHQAEAYISQVNDELNFALVMLNDIYIDIHTHFRKLWFYLNNGEKGQTNERKVIEYLGEVDKAFSFMVNHNDTQNANFLVFQKFKVCLDYFDMAIKVLQTVELNRNAELVGLC